MLLATDLDGTFLAGSPMQKRDLYQWLKLEKNIQLVYVTGRAIPLILPLLQDASLPRPDFIIGDVGATIADFNGELIGEFIAEIDAQWPGEDAVMQALEGLPLLRRQEQPQARRCSFYCDSVALSDSVKARLVTLECDVLFSAGHYLDVLPRNINKGSSLKRLVRHLNIQTTDVLVAGDTLNDLSMYTHGFNGVCVNGSETGLLLATRDMPTVLHAVGPGCEGISEAISHFYPRSSRT
jgi:hydroxymethylpyrimidine pyrophosphatase-like HAD family hydrolase